MCRRVFFSRLVSPQNKIRNINDSAIVFHVKRNRNSCSKIKEKYINGMQEEKLQQNRQSTRLRCLPNTKLYAACIFSIR